MNSNRELLRFLIRVRIDLIELEKYVLWHDMAPFDVLLVHLDAYIAFLSKSF